ncbi:MAG: YdcF family protein [Trichodesmium sp. ALOHA_ZT_67]|uniref:YdcF family protein n=1 Tax=Trichodesmium erythraeum TaxID=1206 RepID=UPI0000392527|nr:YdcF family protein [Trichodesmium erythraeum GBRTRLIN201]MCH2048550.1 YdcF family protein [Trichodesmium sp. ALOHA_ZT_67]MDE5093526.1 YdcF family protein [Trichodesmium sp. St11_bin5]MDT9340871.1 YdcF family protein [Trichodesmium erythraeum 21-75]
MLIILTRIVFCALLICIVKSLWDNSSGDKKNLISKLLLVFSVILLMLAFYAPDSPVGAAVFRFLAFAFKPLGFSIILLVYATTLISGGGIKNPAPALIITALIVMIISSAPVFAVWSAQQVEEDAIEIVSVSACCDEKADAIVLLGQGTTQPIVPDRIQIQLTKTAERITYAAELYKKGLAPYIIVSAGPRIGEDINTIEAEDITRVLVLLNVPRTAIIIEPHSSTVYESAIETREILNERGLDPTVILVSSAIQIRRASLTFTDIGMKVIPAPTDFNTVNPYENSSYRFVLADFFPNTEAISLTTEVWEEYLALFYYFLRGWLAPSF